MQIGANTMSKQSNPYVMKRFDKITLPSDFPITAGEHSPSIKPVSLVHRHNCLELGYCHKGSGIFMIDDKIIPFFAGDVSVITEYEFHIAQSVPTLQAWTFISLNPTELLYPCKSIGIEHFSGWKFPNILTQHKHGGIIALVREIISELEFKQPNYQDAVKGIAMAIMCKLHRIGSKVNRNDNLHVNKIFERIAPAINYIHANYMKAIRISKLAKFCHLSEPHFRRLFVSATGKSPQEYLTHLRISLAGILLKDGDRQILDIALLVGYPSLSGFNRHFRRIMDCSPRNWRNLEKLHLTTDITHHHKSIIPQNDY